MLISEALRGRPRDDYVLSVKFGALRDPAGGFIGYDARPEAVKNALAYSLKRLGVDFIDIYRPARLDPAVPIEDTIGAIADMVGKGYVRSIGLSEVNAATIRRAAAVHPIVDLQIEYSLVVRMIEAEILPACRALGIGDHRLRGAGAGAHLRPLDEGAGEAAGLPHFLLTLRRRESRPQSCAGRSVAQSRCMLEGRASPRPPSPGRSGGGTTLSRWSAPASASSGRNRARPTQFV